MAKTHRPLLLILQLTVAATGRAGEFWVDVARGDDANPGTYSEPVRSLRALAGLRTGSLDVFHVGPGIYGPASGDVDQFGLLEGDRLIGSGPETVFLDLSLGSVFTDTVFEGLQFVSSSPFPRAAVTLQMLRAGVEGSVETRTVRRCRFVGSHVLVYAIDQLNRLELRVTIEANEFVGVLGPAVRLAPWPFSSPFVEEVVVLDLRNNMAVGCDSFFEHGAVTVGLTSTSNLVNNTILDSIGDAIILQGWPFSSLTSLTSNIISGGAGYGVREGSGDEVVDLRNNLFDGLAGGAYLDGGVGLLQTAAELNGQPWASDNLDAVPLFVDRPASDLRLAAGSPGIDQGLDAAAPPFDFAGDPRPLDGDGDSFAVADIGADEYRAGPRLLRNGDFTSIDPLTPARATVLPLGSPRDDYPLALPADGIVDPGVLGDLGRPLVLYELLRSGNDLWLSKLGGEVFVSYGRAP